MTKKTCHPHQIKVCIVFKVMTDIHMINGNIPQNWKCRIVLIHKKINVYLNVSGYTRNVYTRVIINGRSAQVPHHFIVKIRIVACKPNDRVELCHNKGGNTHNRLQKGRNQQQENLENNTCSNCLIQNEVKSLQYQTIFDMLVFFKVIGNW